MVLSLLPDLGKRTLVMGILNVTPDSFSDGGRYASVKTALAHARAMIAEGVDILDVGGESTRPGATEVGAEEEIARVLPVIERLAATERTPPISIDTYKAKTAEAALGAGARIVNDVWGLQREPDIASVASAHGAAVVVMHNRGDVDPAIDIIEDMKAFFTRSLEIARKTGIPDDHVILDPGVGFGKTFEQNVQAVARVGELKALGFPVLMGTSRKRMIGALIGPERPVTERLHGTVASNVAAILAGADIVRVHDVAAHRDAAAVADAIRKEMR
ncbi:dihydropteroate synthase [Pleomorphomonas sp. JP5]|uniref:dihydropteroate synthase n=1 Tax=Pleomorphomonas sp. JP5 TaxID=2942998 RepID=UPI002043361A|nr:dihydropteroate synthase [Pleomorphomonas sp. JP5]MCM5558738.1 dihydropteroate synthase [Pleomorphomonas sp. JP5]